MHLGDQSESQITLSQPDPFTLCHIMKDQTNTSLKLFTETAILQQIGTRRLAKLLNSFGDDCKTANFLLPIPPDEDHSTINHQSSVALLAEEDQLSTNLDYFLSLAAALASSALPDRLRAALFTLESAASPDNRDRLDSAIQRRIPASAWQVVAL